MQGVLLKNAAELKAVRGTSCNRCCNEGSACGGKEKILQISLLRAYENTLLPLAPGAIALSHHGPAECSNQDRDPYASPNENLPCIKFAQIIQ